MPLSSVETRKAYKEHLVSVLHNELVYYTLVAVLAMVYYIWVDLTSMPSPASALMRVPPLVLGIVLLVLRYGFPHRMHLLRARLFDFLLLTLSLMMYGKLLIHIGEARLENSISGTIMVLFILSLLLRAPTVFIVLFYFGPAVVFALALHVWFDLDATTANRIGNIYPIVIVGFLANRLQSNLRYKAFVANLNLQDEKQLTEQLYEEAHTQNDVLSEVNAALSQKNEEIRVQRDRIGQQHAHLEEVNTRIVQSIQYAERIQQAMLPNLEQLRDYFADYFVLLRPRDMVSGDFYWVHRHKSRVWVVVADCTGHGVPGAMVSMLGISLLQRVVTEAPDANSGTQLDMLRTVLKEALQQQDGRQTTHDGMDLALLAFDTVQGRLQFSGAYNSLYVLRSGEIMCYKADRQPVAAYLRETPFATHEVVLEQGDRLYAFSDGITDLMNMEDRKYSLARLKELLLGMASVPMHAQGPAIEAELDAWRGAQDPVDDMVMLGLEV